MKTKVVQLTGRLGTCRRRKDHCSPVQLLAPSTVFPFFTTVYYVVDTRQTVTVVPVYYLVDWHHGDGILSSTIVTILD